MDAKDLDGWLKEATLKDWREDATVSELDRLGAVHGWCGPGRCACGAEFTGGIAKHYQDALAVMRQIEAWR
jgi:hypothetical protein